MAVEVWIDEIVKQMGTIQSHTGGKLKAYRIASKPEVPEAVGTFPSVVIYPRRLISAQYSMSGSKEIWEVVGDFYLFSDNKKTNLPQLLRYFGRIRNATLASMTLGGKVDHFRFADGEPMSMVTLQDVTDGPEHHGIAVTWEVKVDVTGEVTVGV